MSGHIDLAGLKQLARLTKDSGYGPCEIRPTHLLALVEAVEAALGLYERVEMDESAGICLSSRIESLRLGGALAPFVAGRAETNGG